LREPLRRPRPPKLSEGGSNPVFLVEPPFLDCFAPLAMTWIV
jgi:hypothetical protein